MELADDYWKAIANAGMPLDVLIIDNGSNPPLPNGYRLERNAGFHKACNVGLELARTDAVLFLNNDIAATEAGWALPLVEALEPGVLVGARLRNDPHAQVDGTPFPYLDGWCLAGMREDLLYLEGWDETFWEPAYYGDNDLCLRARANGMRLREARVGLVHKENATAGHSDEVRRATEHNYQRFAALARELIGGQ